MAGATTPRGAPPVKACKRADTTVMQLFSDESSAVAKQVAEQAKGGDTAAQRMVLDRVAPPPSGRAVQFELPEIKSVADAPAAQLALLVACAKGELAPGEALQLSGVIEQYRRQTETADLAARIAALEEEERNGR